MRKILILILTFSVASICSASEKGYQSILKPFLSKYCIECHGAEKNEADLRLDTLKFDLNDFDSVQEWQYVLDELNLSNMPPKKAKQAPVKEMANTIEFLMHTLEKAKKNLLGKDKAIVMRRLNKRDYANSIYELLGVKVDETTLPDDPQSDTFDTDGGNLFMSPFHFQQYQEVAKVAVRDAIDFSPRPKVTSVDFYPVAGSDISPINYNSRAVAKIKDNQNKLKTFLKHVKLPMNKVLTNHKIDKSGKQSRARANMAKVDAELLDHVLISPWGINVKSLNGLANRHLLSMAKMFSQKGSDVLPGTYRFEVTCGYGNMKPGDKAFISIGNDGGKETGLQAVEEYNFVEVTAPLSKPQKIVLETYIDLSKRNSAGDGRIYHIKPLFQNNPNITMGMQKKHKEKLDIPFIMISKVRISGPHHKEWPSASHRKIFPQEKGNTSEDIYIRNVISNFAKKAFRNNPISNSYLAKLFQLYKGERARGKKMAQAIETPLSVILASPGFLYIAEENSDNKKGYISDEELAIRLSYFLWSAPPDETLLKLAKSKKLSDPRVLRSQAIRLIKDKRSSRFSKGFIEQWLQTGQVGERDIPLAVRLQKFASTIQKNMAKEPIHFFDYIMRSNLSMKNFIDSEFVVVDNSLASYYELPAPSKSGFWPVKLPKESPRGGLVGQGAFHLIGSDGEHTKPILRGAFVLKHIIGQPTPEPPPNVDMIDVDSRGKKTAKDLINLHKEKPQCRSCHQKIDPLGWGLENFSAISRWRTEQDLKGMPKDERRRLGDLSVDTAGQMPNGSKYKGLEDFKLKLMTYKHQFAKNLTEKLYSYALGKRITFTDEKSIQAILLKNKNRDYKLGEVLLDIVSTKEFRMK